MPEDVDPLALTPDALCGHLNTHGAGCFDLEKLTPAERGLYLRKVLAAAADCRNKLLDTWSEALDPNLTELERLVDSFAEDEDTMRLDVFDDRVDQILANLATFERDSDPACAAEQDRLAAEADDIILAKRARGSGPSSGTSPEAS